MSTGPQSTATAEAAIPATVFDDEAAAGARAYAEALLNASETAEGGPDAVIGELREILDDVFRDRPKLANMLTDGSLNEADRDRLLARLFEGRALPTVERFLRVLSRHGRLGLLGTVVQLAQSERDRRLNRRPVTVRSASPLDEGQQEALRRKLGGLVGGEPVLTLEVDPELIGGLVVRVGDVVYDASVRARLQGVRRQVLETNLHGLRGRLAEPTASGL